MRVISKAVELQKKIFFLKQKGKKIGFVPTMGCLHEGHLSLIKLAQKKSDVVVVSIFVNPLQFGPQEDFKVYPQTLKADLLKLKKLKVDFVFTPQNQDLYPKGFQTKVHVGALAEGLCGAFRPGHFNGVATVVLKLFQLVQPDLAVFGKKDYQQYLVVKRMVQDFHLPIQILGAPIKREKNGLAMSSRNLRLSDQERQVAKVLSATLFAAKTHFKQQLSISKIKKFIARELAKQPECRVEYIECCSSHDLTPLARYQARQTLVAVAAKVGSVRLIDNIVC